MEYVIGPTLNYKRAVTLEGSAPAGRSTASTRRTVTGICSVFGNKDTGGDVVMPGAFADAIRDFKSGRSRCKFLWNHDRMEPPIAKILDLQELGRDQLPAGLKTTTDVAGGLSVTRQYLADPASDRVYQGVIAGTVTEMSFAYNILDFSYEMVKGERVRLLKKLELMDCSDVTWGMNGLTLATVPKRAIVYNAEKIKTWKLQGQITREQKDRIETLKLFLDPKSRTDLDKRTEARRALADADRFLNDARSFQRTWRAR